MAFESIHEIRETNKRAGYHFFEPENMRFFKSRVLEGVYGGRYFITSEDFGDSDGRRYTIRFANPETGEVRNASDFQKYRTRREAIEAARTLVRDMESFADTY